MLLFSFAKNSTHLVRENPKKGGSRMLRGLYCIAAGFAIAFTGLINILAGISGMREGYECITKKGNE